jgi:hypothetical protein
VEHGCGLLVLLQVVPLPLAEGWSAAAPFEHVLRETACGSSGSGVEGLAQPLELRRLPFVSYFVWLPGRCALGTCLSVCLSGRLAGWLPEWCVLGGCLSVWPAGWLAAGAVRAWHMRAAHAHPPAHPAANAGCARLWTAAHGTCHVAGSVPQVMHAQVSCRPRIS